MHHLIYTSYAVRPLDEAQLRALLTQARHLNAAENSTGLLLYGNGRFLQVLEGEEPDVRAAYARIYCDPRHRQVALYADKAIDARAFPEWKMAYHSLQPDQFAEVVGYLNPADLQVPRPHLSTQDTQLLQLLRLFVLPAR